MRTEIQLFNNPEFGELRTIKDENNKVWFSLNDVMKPLGLTHVTRLRNRLSDDGCTSSTVGVQTGRKSDGSPAIQQVEMIFIDEPNLYRCIFQSRKQEAEKFQDWVFEEVLPSIRNAGGYMVSKEDDTPEVLMARALLLAKDTMERQSKELEKERQRRLDIEQQRNILEGQKQIIEEANTILAPKAKYTDEVLQSTSTFTLTQIALDLGLRSVHVLTGLLSDKGLMYRQSGQWLPTAKVADKKYFTTRTYHYVKSNGTVATSISTVITEKGRMFLHDLVKTLEPA